MASSAPGEPSSASGPAAATAASQHSNPLPLASFLLSCTPLLGLVLYALLLRGVLPISDDLKATSSLSIAIYLGSLSGALAAVVCGVLALRSAKHYAPNQRREGLGVAGLILGTAGVLLLLGIGFLVYSFVQSCSAGVGCFGGY